jgi:hypothetical protein
MSDELLRSTLDDLGIPYLVIGGTLDARLRTMLDVFGITARMSLSEAIKRAAKEMP